MDWKLQLIADTVEEHTLVNMGHTTVESFLGFLEMLHRDGLVYILGDKRANVVVVIYTKRPFVGDVHFFSDNDNVWEVIACLKRARDWVWKTTPLLKLEADITDKSLIPLVKRMGFSQEGIRKSSYMGMEQMMDTYLFGLVKE